MSQKVCGNVKIVAKLRFILKTNFGIVGQFCLLLDIDVFAYSVMAMLLFCFTMATRTSS